MREIKFRWIAPETGKWEYIELGDITTAPSFNDTLGQYTGLKDRHGKEIYELMELNGKHRVIYNAPQYVLQDIINGDIIGMYEKQDEREITGEYSPIQKDTEGSSD